MARGVSCFGPLAALTCRGHMAENDILIYFTGHIPNRAGEKISLGDDDMTAKLKGVLGKTKFLGFIGTSNLYSVIEPAKKFIIDNVQEDSKVIIYGYSIGGYDAMCLAAEVSADPPEMGELYYVDLLITVDAAAWENSGRLPRRISRNVRTNLNYYQKRGSLARESHGDKNDALGKNTVLCNIHKEKSTHHSIREDTMDDCIAAIRNCLKVTFDGGRTWPESGRTRDPGH